jgi:lipoprotein NlpD
MLSHCKTIFCLFVFVLLAGCGVNEGMAPVIEPNWRPFFQSPKMHIVKKSETLYSISFRYGLDFQQVAVLNHLRPPYTVRIGQRLNLQGIARKPTMRRGSPISRAVRNKYTRPKPKASSAPIFSPRYTGRSSSGWLWPVNGRVVTSFIPDQGKKGINIACTNGEKVRASTAGVVAYAGNGLTGYGNLIIVKHNNEYLTAYGNNAKNLVSEGQRVTAGQIIAIAGIVDHKYTGVHFEIRKRGVPVNPLNYLQKG